MITHIATAATEQSSATEQVNTNMEQIATLVRESAVGAQQSAKACGELSNLALDLQSLVSRFKLDNGEKRKSAGRPSGRSVGSTKRAAPRNFKETHATDLHAGLLNQGSEHISSRLQ